MNLQQRIEQLEKELKPETVFESNSELKAWFIRKYGKEATESMSADEVHGILRREAVRLIEEECS